MNLKYGSRENLLTQGTGSKNCGSLGMTLEQWREVRRDMMMMMMMMMATAPMNEISHRRADQTLTCSERDVIGIIHDDLVGGYSLPSLLWRPHHLRTR